MRTKDQILLLLEKNRGFYISGEKFAQELGISRTAVWKAVRKLRRDGYDIRAVTNRGYCLSKESDLLSVVSINSHLNEYCGDLRLEVFREIDSTNRVCLDKASQGESEGYVAVAGKQTAGRGRRGRNFYSPSDTGIYMSILLRPVRYLGSEALKLTTMAAAAVSDALEYVSEKKTEIKWVNDILIDGKKVSGILCEALPAADSSDPGAVVVGIGINAYPPEGGFPEEIAETAGSVFDKPGHVRRSRIAAEVLNRFMRYYKSEPSDEYFKVYKKRSMVIDKDVEIIAPGLIRRAHVTGLNDDCSLSVRYEDGSTGIINSGEVSILPAK